MSTPLSPSLLAERAKAHAEPSWLSEARLQALASYESLEAPKWLRTDLAGLAVEALAAKAAASPAPRRVHARAEGLLHMPLQQAAREHPDVVRAVLSAPSPVAEKWARLHHALWTDGSLVFVEKDKTVEAPVQVDNRMGAAGAVLRDLILLAPGARAHVVLRSAGASRGALAMEGLDIELQANASLQLATLQDADHGATLLTTRRVRVHRDARLQWIDGLFGGGKVVGVNETRLVGQGATFGYVGAFFGSGDQHFDLTTSAMHDAPHTSSDLKMKGALSDDGYAVNYSIVNIGPDARNSSGHQHQETLLLSSRARADAIPKLDVENNEVSASHGATVGQVDEDQLFYLRSRGLSESQARRVIVEGFFEPLLREIPVEEAREEIRAAILSRLGG